MAAWADSATVATLSARMDSLVAAAPETTRVIREVASKASTFQVVAQLLTWAIAGAVGFGSVFLRRHIEVKEKRFIITAAVLDEMLSLVVLLREAREGLAHYGITTTLIRESLAANMARYDRASDYVVHLRPLKRAATITAWFREVRSLQIGLKLYVAELGQPRPPYIDGDTLRSAIALIDSLVQRGDTILMSYGVDRKKKALAAGWKPEDV